MLDRAKPGHSSLVDDRELAPAFLEHQRESIAQRGRRGDGGIKRVVAVWNGKQLDVRESPQREAFETAVRTHEAGHELVRGVGEDGIRRVVLREDAALAQDGDPVPHLDRLVDVMGDEDHCLADLGVQAEELLLQPFTRDRIQCSEGLVHQHDGRIRGHRPGQSDTLLLPARKLSGVPIGIVNRVQPDEHQQLAHPAVDPRLRPAQEARDRRNVVGNAHVREQSDVLDHVADPAAELDHLQAADAPAVHQDVAVGDLDQPVDHLHRRRLAPARRADEHADFSRRDAQGEVVDGRSASPGIALRDVAEDNLRG